MNDVSSTPEPGELPDSGAPGPYPPPRFPMLPTVSVGFARGRAVAGYASAFWRDGTIWCGRGCDALELILHDAGINGENGRILVPAVHCPSIPQAIRRAGAAPAFYRVGPDLTPDMGDIDRLFRDGARGLVLIHYFGFRQEVAPLRAVCERYRAILIEDCAHAFFGMRDAQLPGEAGHYAIASPRKFFPIPDGGAALSNSSPLGPELLAPVSWPEEARRVARTLQAGADYGRLGALSRPLSILFRHLDRGRQRAPGTSVGVDRHPSRRKTPAPPARMSTTAQVIMGMTDIQRLAERRRANFLALLAGVSRLEGCHALFGGLPPECVPYVFPLVLHEPRDTFAALKVRGVPMFRWEAMEGPGCPTARRYEEQLIQLPCHQELSSADIDWLLAELRAVLGGART